MSTITPTPRYEQEAEPFLLAHIAACLNWLEDLTAMLSGPLLTAGLLLAIIDLLTDGKLFLTQPELLYGWAIAMGVGLDAQLVGASAKLGRAWRTGRYTVVAGYIVLVAALAYVCFVAAWVFAVQQAYGITTADALARLGLDSATWLWQRTALSVFLVVLSGLLRVQRRKQVVNAAAAVAEIAAKQQVGLARIQQMRAYRDALRGHHSPTLTPEPPTDGGTPIATPAADHPPLLAPELPDDLSAIAEPDAEPDSPPRRTGTRLVALPRTRTGNRSGNRPTRRTQAQLRAMAFGLLDAGEVTTRAALRESLRPIRQETANRLFTAWELDRGRQGQPRQVRAARAR